MNLNPSSLPLTLAVTKGVSSTVVMMFMLIMLFLGLAGGILGTVGIRWLLRRGAALLVSVNPMTMQYSLEYGKLTGSRIKMGKGDKEKMVDLEAATPLTEVGSGRKGFLLDDHAGVGLTVDKEESRLVHPDGKRLMQNFNSVSYNRMNEEEKQLDLKTVALFGLIAVVVIVGMLIYVISKVGSAAAGVAHG